MASNQDDAIKGDGYVRCLQISVFVYGFVNILVRGAELLLAVISTSVIVVPYITGIHHDGLFQGYLNEEAKHAVYRGPFSTSFNISGFLDEPENGNLTKAVNNSTSMKTIMIDETQQKIDLHVWSVYILMKFVTVLFAFILVFSAKKFSFSGNLAWLSYSIPVLAQYALQFTLDLSLGNYFERKLPLQIWQGVDLGFQALGIFIVSIFLNRLYHLDDRIPGIDRYNGFPSRRLNGDISITEIIEDAEDQRYK